MSKTIDLTDRLTRLNKTVEHTIRERNEQAQVTQVAKQDRKRREWESVCEHAPDHAALITALGAGFGKLASVRVCVGSETILDSTRYE